MKNLILLIVLVLISQYAFPCEGINDQIKDLDTEITELRAEYNQCMNDHAEDEAAKQDPETEAPEEEYGDQEANDE